MSATFRQSYPRLNSTMNIFAPVLTNEHYVCVVVNFKTKQIQMLDNMVHKKQAQPTYRSVVRTVVRKTLCFVSV